MKIFLAFGCFRIDGQKQYNFDFQCDFSMSKINQVLLVLFFIEENIKKRGTFINIICILKTYF